MKGKLIKGKKQYSLLVDKKDIGNFDTIKTSLGFIIADEFGIDVLKLLKKNCDEIFEVIDVYKLAKQKYPNVDNEDYEYDSGWQMLSDEYKKIGFIQGAKSILELNKDKLFTVDQLNKAYYRMENRFKNEPFEVFLEHIQQPTEMEVEIEMDKIPADLAPGGWDVFPKLDEEGCLILRKI